MTTEKKQNQYTGKKGNLRQTKITVDEITFSGQEEWSFIRIGKSIPVHVSSSVLTLTVFVLPFILPFQCGAQWSVYDFLHKALTFPPCDPLRCTSSVRSRRNQPKSAVVTDFLRSQHVKCGSNKISSWRKTSSLLSGKGVCWPDAQQGLHLKCLHIRAMGTHQSNILPAVAPGPVGTSWGRADFKSLSPLWFFLPSSMLIPDTSRNFPAFTSPAPECAFLNVHALT